MTACQLRRYAGKRKRGTLTFIPPDVVGTPSPAPAKVNLPQDMVKKQKVEPIMGQLEQQRQLLTLALDKYGEEFRLYLAGKKKFYDFMQIMGRQGLKKPFPLNHASKEQLTDLIEQAQDIATTAMGLMASEHILTGYELRTLQDILTQVATHDLESFAAVMTADINSQIDLFSAKDTVYKFYKNNYQWIKNEQNVLDMPVTMEWKPGGPDGKGGFRSILKPGQGKGPDPGGASSGPDTGGYMTQEQLKLLMQADVDMKNAELSAGIATGTAPIHI